MLMRENHVLDRTVSQSINACNSHYKATLPSSGTIPAIVVPVVHPSMVSNCTDSVRNKAICQFKRRLFTAVSRVRVTGIAIVTTLL